MPDLRLLSAEPSDAERAAVDAVVGEADLLAQQGFELLGHGLQGVFRHRLAVGAAQVGMQTIFARYGDTFGTVISHADYEVDDISQVIDIVKQLNVRS